MSHERFLSQSDDQLVNPKPNVQQAVLTDYFLRNHPVNLTHPSESVQHLEESRPSVLRLMSHQRENKPTSLNHDHVSEKSIKKRFRFQRSSSPLCRMKTEINSSTSIVGSSIRHDPPCDRCATKKTLCMPDPRGFRRQRCESCGTAKVRCSLVPLKSSDEHGGEPRLFSI